MAGAATQILLKQAPPAIAAVPGAFLTAGERWLLLARVGHGLLISDINRTGFEPIASRADNSLRTAFLEIGEAPDEFWRSSGKEAHVVLTAGFGLFSLGCGSAVCSVRSVEFLRH